MIPLPITPLHYPAAYLLRKSCKRLSLPGLAVGAMIPDLEVLFFLLWIRGHPFDRLVLHSLLGAATLGTLIAVIVTHWIYPPVISWLFSIDYNVVKHPCRLTWNLGLSCFLGAISHVVIDLLNHRYNPIFWPLEPFTFSPINLVLDQLFSASLVTHALFGIACLALLYYHRDNPWETLLVGDNKQPS